MNNVRLAEEKSGCICAIAVDTAGPELTVLNLPKAPVAFKAGSAVTITSNTATPFSSEHIAVDYSFEVGLGGLHAGSVITLDRYVGCIAILIETTCTCSLRSVPGSLCIMTCAKHMYDACKYVCM